MFQIYRIDPIYCGITDGMIGNTIRPLPMIYRSAALAQKLAARLSEEAERYGDAAFYARPAGFPYREIPNPRPLLAWSGDAGDHEIPF